MKAQGGPSLVFSASGLLLVSLPSGLLLLAGYDSIGVAMLLVLGGVLALGGLGWAVLRLGFDAVSRGLKSWRAR